MLPINLKCNKKNIPKNARSVKIKIHYKHWGNEKLNCIRLMFNLSQHDEKKAIVNPMNIPLGNQTEIQRSWWEGARLKVKKL